MSLNKFVAAVNKHLSSVFTREKGCAVYGLAQTVLTTAGVEESLMPCVIKADGEYEYVGIDDIYGITMYHKNTSISVQTVSKNAVGDSLGNTVNTYTNKLIVLLDKKKISKVDEFELLLNVQTNLPVSLIAEPYKNVLFRVTGAEMNGRAIFEREYKGAKLLPVEKVLFEINYTIESTFENSCFAKCLF